MRVLITGASRGIGAAVARAFARHHGEGKKDCVLALLGRSLSSPSHANLKGTLLDTAREVERLGATAVPLYVDARDGDALRRTVQDAVHSLGGLDVLVNNASALVLPSSSSLKHMDLVHAVNARATMLCLDGCREALSQSSFFSSAGSVVTLSPPLRLGRLDWISQHGVPYTLSKYDMTLATLAEASDRVRANCVWPRYTVATSATARLEASGSLPHAHSRGRAAEDVGEAVYRVATHPTWNARTLLDDEAWPEMPPPPMGAPLDAFVEEEVVMREIRRGDELRGM